MSLAAVANQNSRIDWGPCIDQFYQEQGQEAVIIPLPGSIDTMGPSESRLYRDLTNGFLPASLKPIAVDPALQAKVDVLQYHAHVVGANPLYIY